MLRKSAAVFSSVAVCTVVVLLPGTSKATQGTQPPGLTAQGRAVWNLEALLHDTFGRRAVWLHYGANPRRPDDFRTVSGALCCSGEYYFTFANASGSAFVPAQPTRRPRAIIGASGGETPLTIRGSYIACPGGRWLYRHYGNGPANWRLSCRKP